MFWKSKDDEANHNTDPIVPLGIRNNSCHTLFQMHTMKLQHPRLLGLLGFDVLGFFFQHTAIVQAQRIEKTLKRTCQK